MRSAVSGLVSNNCARRALQNSHVFKRTHTIYVNICVFLLSRIEIGPHTLGPRSGTRPASP